MTLGSDFYSVWGPLRFRPQEASADFPMTSHAQTQGQQQSLCLVFRGKAYLTNSYVTTYPNDRYSA